MGMGRLGVLGTGIFLVDVVTGKSARLEEGIVVAGKGLFWYNRRFARASAVKAALCSVYPHASQLREGVVYDSIIRQCSVHHVHVLSFALTSCP